MINNPEKISVALCTYNGDQFLEEQLNSIFTQTHPVDELIICDDGSIDGTLKILEYYKKKYPEVISLYSNKEKLFTIKNFEKAISLTSGDYIFLSDQDDIWSVDKVEQTLSFFRSNTFCHLMFTNAHLINENSEILENSLWEAWSFDEACKQRWQDQKFQIIDLIQNKNKVTGATVAFRKNLKQHILPLNLPKNVWHDCYMALTAAGHNGLGFLDEKLVKYRIHSSQQVGVNIVNTATNKFTVSLETYREKLIKDFKPYISYFDAKYFTKEEKKDMKLSSWLKRKLKI